MITKLLFNGATMKKYGASWVGGVKYYVSEIYEKKWIEDAIFDTKSVRLAVCLKEDDSYIGTYISQI